MTEGEALELKSRASEWRKRAEPVGPMHSAWEMIFDAEAHLDGHPEKAVLSVRQLLEMDNR